MGLYGGSSHASDLKRNITKRAGRTRLRRRIPGAKPGTPAAMIIGAAHTEGVTWLLRERLICGHHARLETEGWLAHP